jgi:DNA modification methylase
MDKLINKITTGDARELTKLIPDESIDLIFTDPVYDRIEDYEWLAKEAARILKPNSACLVWIANPRYDKILMAMQPFLSSVMPLIYVKTGGTNLIFSRKIFGWGKICLWFEIGKSTPRKAIPDVILSGKMPAGTHKWNKNPEAILLWLDAFCEPSTIVFDPFTGSGIIPSVCKILGRNYIAFEIDPETAELARERVLNTQPPLFTLEPEQLELEESK